MANKRGFTLIELIIVIAVIVIIIGWFGAGGIILKGNYWFTEESVLKELRIDYPNVSSILKTERNVYSYSKILVENKDGSRAIFLLDSNVLFNYKFFPERGDRKGEQ